MLVLDQAIMEVKTLIPNAARTAGEKLTLVVCCAQSFSFTVFLLN